MKSPLLLILLAACTHPSLPEPLEVDVPLPIACAQPVAEPDWRIPKLPPDADPVARLRAALTDLALGQGYIGELKAVLSACS